MHLQRKQNRTVFRVYFYSVCLIRSGFVEEKKKVANIPRLWLKAKADGINSNRFEDYFWIIYLISVHCAFRRGRGMRHRHQGEHRRRQISRQRGTHPACLSLARPSRFIHARLNQWLYPSINLSNTHSNTGDLSFPAGNFLWSKFLFLKICYPPIRSQLLFRFSKEKHFFLFTLNKPKLRIVLY